MSSDGLNKGRTTIRRSWLLNVGLIIIAFELMAFLLLKIGMDEVVSLGVSVSGAVIVIFRQHIILFGRSIFNGSRKLARAIEQRAMDRRTWQFSLRTLLIVFVIVALLCGWYRYRLNNLYREQALIYGKWRMVDEAGKPVIYNDAEIVITFDTNNCTIYPTHTPKWMDIYGQWGRSKCIYCFEGEKLRISQSSPGLQRPDSFSFNKIPSPEPGVLISQGSKTVYLLDRILEEKNPDRQ